MAEYYIAPKSSFDATADAIREKTGSQATIEWTEDGFADAIAAIPSGGKMRLIRTITVPDTLPAGGVDSSGVNWVECSSGGFNFGFSTDSNGDSFDLTKISVHYAAYTADNQGKSNCVRISNNANPGTVGKITSIRTDKSFNNVGNWFAENIGNGWFSGSVAYGLGSSAWENEWGATNNAYSSMTAFSIMAVYPATVGFAPGSTFEIWGA